MGVKKIKFPKCKMGMIILILLSGCVKDYDFSPWTTLVQQIHKASYDETRVKTVETFTEKHPQN